MLKLTPSKKRTIFFIAIGWALLLIGDRIGELRQYQGSFVAMYALAIASIILLTGYSGQLSLGHSALMAVGAYAGALSINNLHLHPAIALVIATFVAGIFGLLLGFGVARLSGPYLAGTTLALAVSLPTLANQFPILGGEQGVVFDVGLPPARFGENFSQYKWFFWISCLAVLIMLWLISNFVSSRYGRTFRAIRDNETAASLAGLNTGRLKVLAFAISSGMAGLAGGLLVMLISGVSPSAFPLSLSFSLLTGAVVTGVYSLRGVMLGGLVLVAIPEIADSLVTRIGGSEGFTATLPGFLVSALLILAVLFAPNGPGTLLHSIKKHH
ncbi:branched-chain amino acid transport system permease protein [Candidatus Planktophila limnetica]|jgi:branched-chain amino acid transport system permease protein|uniref:Branched-chain amino acid transport system permease protein n=1 Tax=Candidatus Planktophila limnetica TaxID=573600 RepID=A0A249LEB5_9ACTN|nr:branched-chain amino acid ABC transporter permease [Candidatus Planktophila limnetica]ASY27337.1 branched-chain amino acid transport system permease protein [Candidatus Planktophila limnetica]